MLVASVPMKLFEGDWIAVEGAGVGLAGRRQPGNLSWRSRSERSISAGDAVRA